MAIHSTGAISGSGLGVQPAAQRSLGLSPSPHQPLLPLPLFTRKAASDICVARRTCGQKNLEQKPRNTCSRSRGPISVYKWHCGSRACPLPWCPSIGRDMGCQEPFLCWLMSPSWYPSRPVAAEAQRGSVPCISQRQWELRSQPGPPGSGVLASRHWAVVLTHECT